MRRREEGIALVEFALVLPVLLILIVGVFDVALAVWQSNTLATAVREGTRLAIVRGAESSSPIGPADHDELIERVEDAAVGLTGITVTATWPDGSNKRGQRVSVVATAPYRPILSQAFLDGALSVTLRAGSELVIHR